MKWQSAGLDTGSSGSAGALSEAAREPVRKAPPAHYFRYPTLDVSIHVATAERILA